MMNTRVISNISQLQYESDSWKRTIEFIIQENAHAKNRLAEIIKNNPGEDAFLDLAEFYQNYFIQQETLASLLRNDIYSFDKVLQKQKIEDEQLINEVLRNRKQLKSELDKLINEFNRSKKQFDNFVEANS